MRPGIPGSLQLNPDKVRLMSMWMSKFRPPKVANIFPNPRMGGGMGGAMGGRPPGMGGMGGGMMPKLDLRGGMR